MQQPRAQRQQTPPSPRKDQPDSVIIITSRSRPLCLSALNPLNGDTFESSKCVHSKYGGRGGLALRPLSSQGRWLYNHLHFLKSRPFSDQSCPQLIGLVETQNTF